MKIQAVIVALAVAGAGHAAVRYGTGLDSLGSRQPAHTVFTAPGADASRSASISWASPCGAHGGVLLTTADDTAWLNARFIPSAGTRCDVYDGIPSKTGDNRDCHERHIFDKHGVDVDSLQPDTRYIYRIAGDDGYRGTVHRFKTAPVAGSPWKAAVIGDFHHYSPLWTRLDNAMGMIDTLDSLAGGIDFVLSTGDQCAWGGSYNYWTEVAAQPQYHNFMWAPVQGNHDHWDAAKGRNDGYFRNAWHLPQNGYPGQEGICYWFKYGDVLFVMLNNEAMRTRATLDTARQWIEEVITANPSRYTVVVEHYEWIIATDGSDSQLERFTDLFDRLGVDLALSGNNHAYLRTWPLDGNGRPSDTGTVYVVNPSSDNSRGRALKDLTGHRDAIVKRWSEGAHTVGAMLLDVTPARMMLTLYDRHGRPVDSVTVNPRRP